MGNEQALLTLTRVGFAARGLLYLVIAWLIIRTGNAEDMGGALQYVASGGGQWMLIVLAAGFVAYGAWRLLDAALNTENHGDGTKGTVKRAGAAVSGIVYLFLAYQAYELLSGSGGGGGGSGTQQQTEAAMDLPGGSTLVVIASIVLAGAGIWQVVKGFSGAFLKHLDAGIANRDWVKWFGTFGYAARGIIFLVSAWFLFQAGASGNSAQSGGMEQALQWLSSPVNLIVALGLAMFGVFSLIEARYRQISGPNRGDLSF